MFAQCDTDFVIDRYLIPYLQEVPFFAELSRQIRKTPTRDIPTAAVSWNSRSDELILFFNPEFLNSLTDWQIRNVLTHELYHIIFGHLNARRKQPDELWNVATDLAINSIIVNNSRDSKPRNAKNDDTPLPISALIPGQFPVHPNGRELSEEEKSASKVAQLIALMPHMQASEYYFQRLLNELPEDGPNLGLGGFGTLDDHSLWDGDGDGTGDNKEYVEGRIKAIIEKAVRYADSVDGWGSMPADLIADIRRSVSTIVNWRAVLRQFIGSLIRGNRRTSIKKINKKYPYIHPGVKRSYVARLLIAIDESWSVDDEMLVMFFAELMTLTKRVTIDILPFDSHASESQIYTWRRGTVPKPKRVKGGGTSFEAPTQIFNDPKNRGRWDGMLIMTDGECSKPSPTRKRRGWILGKGHELMFPSDEIQIFLDKKDRATGAWR